MRVRASSALFQDAPRDSAGCPRRQCRQSSVAERPYFSPRALKSAPVSHSPSKAARCGGRQALQAPPSDTRSGGVLTSVSCPLLRGLFRAPLGRPGPGRGFSAVKGILLAYTHVIFLSILPIC